MQPATAKWYGRRDSVFIEFCVEDSRDVQVNFDKSKLDFSCVSGTEDIKHQNAVELFGEIDPKESKHRRTDRSVLCCLRKAEAGKSWPRLTKDEEKCSWLTVDFNNWKDWEDDSKEDLSSFDKFSEMMNSMGGDDLPDLDGADDEHYSADSGDKKVLVPVFGHDEEGTEIEPEIEEEVSEVEDDTDFDPDFEETDESTDGEGEAPKEQAHEEPFQSKSGHLLWSPSPQDRRSGAKVKNKIKMKPGPTRYAVSRVDDIKSSFELFLTDSIQEIILKMTNLEGRRVFPDTWREIDLVDLQAYLGLLILAGVHRSNNEATESLWDGEFGRPIFRATMSLKQFHIIARVIQFDNRDTRPVRWHKDKLAAIRNIWDRWVERLPLMYNPGPEVTVDERLVSFKGRCAFKVYMPSKPGKYGIKIWVACDAKSSYAWNMQVYMGKPSTGNAEKNQGMRVVLDMTTGLQGHNITCDNFFTSYALGEELLKRKLTMVGTVRKNKPELPPALESIRGREVLSSKFAFTDTHTLVSYVPKRNKNVILMSTLHKDDTVSTTEGKKPLMILDYNKNKGGVDCLDMVTGTYTCKRRTARWTVVLFHNILDVSAYNAYVVWTAIDPTWNQAKTFKRRLFLAELGKALVTPLIQRRQCLPRAPASANLVKSVQAPASALAAPPQQGQERKRMRCKLCGPNSRKTCLRCCKCDIYACKTHSDLRITCHLCA